MIGRGRCRFSVSPLLRPFQMALTVSFHTESSSSAKFGASKSSNLARAFEPGTLSSTGTGAGRCFSRSHSARLFSQYSGPVVGSSGFGERSEDGEAIDA